MATVITEAEVYSESDPGHAVAIVSRGGGGLYKVKLADGTILRSGTPAPDDENLKHLDYPFDTYDEAVAAAEAYAVNFDNTAEGKQAALAHLNMLQADEIRRLREQVALRS